MNETSLPPLSRLRLAGSALALATTVALGYGCASPASQRFVAGADFIPGAACNGDAVTPQIVETNPAVLAPAVFERAAGWEVGLAFRIDERGTPGDIDVTMKTVRDDAEAIVPAVRAAFAGYRFCAPVAFSPATRWTASLRFRPVFASSDSRDTRMFVQMFIPAYTRDDVHAGRAGTNRVKATFTEAGKPSALVLVASSGDAVLDQKSLQAMASWQLDFRPGVEPKRPITFEQPYTYAIH